MATSSVNGDGMRGRAGAETLLLLAKPLNVLILQALGDGPKQRVELRRETGLPAQTTLRAELNRLTEVGALEKRRQKGFPRTQEYELTAAGRELLPVAATLDRWLELAPDASLPLRDREGRAAIKTLVEAWSTTMLRALAPGPLSLTELDRLIPSLSYPALERRLAAMRLVGQIERRSNGGSRTPYAVNDWLRRGVAPLVAAMRWEGRFQPRGARHMGRLDAETAFLLAVPLLRLPEELSGSCRLAAELTDGQGRRLAGVTLELDGGRVAACATRLEGSPDAWALGSAPAWLEAMVDNDVGRLELGGRCRLARSVLENLHGTLFGAGAAPESRSCRR